MMLITGILPLLNPYHGREPPTDKAALKLRQLAEDIGGRTEKYESLTLSVRWRRRDFKWNIARRSLVSSGLPTRLVVVPSDKIECFVIARYGNVNTLLVQGQPPLPQLEHGYLKSSAANSLRGVPGGRPDIMLLGTILAAELVPSILAILQDLGYEIRDASWSGLLGHSVA